MPGKNKSQKSKTTQPEVPEQLELITLKLDKVISRLDALVSLSLDFLLSDANYENPVEYTDKAVRLDALGIERDAITGIVRRPSNYVSSRLRESKKRKYSRRQARVKKMSSVPGRDLANSSRSEVTETE